MLDTFKKLSRLLDGRERRNAFLLFGMMIILGLIEVVGVTSIMPFISILAKPDLIQTNSYLDFVYNKLGFTNTNSFLLLLAVIFFVVTIIRVSFATLTQYAIVRFYNMRNLSLSTRLLERYLKQPYSWFLNRHSSDLGRTILTEVDHVVNWNLKPFLEIVAHSLVSIFLVALLIAVEPLIAFTALISLGSAYILLYLGVKKLLHRIGEDRLSANQQRYQIAQELLSGIKQVKFSGSESVFMQRFRKPAIIFHRRRATSNIINQLPRYLFEAFTIGGMLIVVMVLLIRAQGDLTGILPIIGLYAFTAMRLLPLLQQIYSNLTKMSFGRAALEALYKELTAEDSPETGTVSQNFSPLKLRESITAKNVIYTYPGSDEPVIRGLSFTIRSKTTVGFVGSTGAGKSTILDLLIGLLVPQTGQIFIDDTPITNNNLRNWQKSIGYVPQHIFLSDESIAQNIAFGLPPDKIDRETVEKVARTAELHEFITNVLPHGYDTKVGEQGIRLSGGQRQRIGIARALYNDPDVLVLDEATSALDNITEKAIIEALKNLSNEKTVLIVAHRLSTVRNCEQIFYLENGRIKANGTFDELSEIDDGFRQIASVA